MQTTDNYGLKVYEGADLFNPLTVENPNTEALDLIIKAISDQAIGTATELTTGTVHALTRSDSDQALFRFTATSNFAAGDTFTVDTVQVSALTINGQALPDAAYLAGAEVLCALVGTRLTVYGVTGSTTADNALKLGGELPSYYGKATDVTLAQNTANAAGLLAQQLDGRVQALENAGTGLKPTTLWTNPDPTVAFAGQAIQLSDDIANYDFYQVIMVLSAAYSTSVVEAEIIPIQYAIYAESNRNGVMNARILQVPSGTSLTVGDAYYKPTYGGSNVADNGYLIPVRVIGYKA